MCWNFSAITKHMSPPMEIVKLPKNEDINESEENNHSFANVEEMISSEQLSILNLLSCALTIAPSMLGNDAIKKDKTGNNLHK